MNLGANYNSSSAYVNSGSTVQTAHAIFFPCPAKLDTSSGMVLGENDNFSSANVNSGSTVQPARAVFFPCPAKLDTLSHPVSAWNIVFVPSLVQGRLLFRELQST